MFAEKTLKTLIMFSATQLMGLQKLQTIKDLSDAFSHFIALDIFNPNSAWGLKRNRQSHTV